MKTGGDNKLLVFTFFPLCVHFFYSAQCKIAKDIRVLNVLCKPSYLSSKEDHDTYGTKWVEWTNETCSTTDDDATTFCPWNYYSSKRLANPAYHGDSGITYDGGGYVTQWEDFTANAAINSARNLEEHNWLDRYTAAVFIEFAIYNANINLFSYVTFLLEFSPMGNINPYPWVHTFRLYDYTSAEDIQAITISLTYLLFVLSLIYFIIKEVDDIKRSGRKYLLSLSNWLEMSIIISSVVVLVAYLTRKMYVDSTSRALQKALDTGWLVLFQIWYYHVLILMISLYP